MWPFDDYDDGDDDDYDENSFPKRRLTMFPNSPKGCCFERFWLIVTPLRFRTVAGKAGPDIDHRSHAT